VFVLLQKLDYQNRNNYFLDKLVFLSPQIEIQSESSEHSTGITGGSITGGSSGSIFELHSV